LPQARLTLSQAYLCTLKYVVIDKLLRLWYNASMTFSIGSRDAKRFGLPAAEMPVAQAAAALAEARTAAEAQQASRLEAAIAFSEAGAALGQAGLWGMGVAAVYGQQELDRISRRQQDAASVAQETL
jgi:hypothetical protein